MAPELSEAFSPPPVTLPASPPVTPRSDMLVAEEMVRTHDFIPYASLKMATKLF